jgi:hypothetical protein
MVDFYSYIPTNTTMPCIRNTTIQAAQATHTPDITEQNGAGTSISTAAIVCIIAAVLGMFIGLAWFAHHDLVTSPSRKKMLLREKRGRKNIIGGQEEGEFV